MRFAADSFIAGVKRAMAFEADGFYAIPTEKRLGIRSNAHGTGESMQTDRATLPLFALDPQETSDTANQDCLGRKSVRDEVDGSLMGHSEDSTKLGDKKQIPADSKTLD